MKLSILFALAALLGVAMAMSVSKSKAAKMYQVLSARRLKGGEKEGSEEGKSRPPGKGKGSDTDSDSSDEDENAKKYMNFQSMLALASLTNKCQFLVAYMYEAGVTDETFVEAWEGGVKEDAPTLYEACPKVKEFFDYYSSEEMTDEGREMMVQYMTPFGFLLQCTNLFADLDSLKYMGFTDDAESENASLLMVHGQSLLDGCKEVFGEGDKEVDQVEEDIDAAEQAAENQEANELRSLLAQLKQAIRNRK